MGTDNTINIVRAKQSDIQVLVPLFDQYRVFYGQNSNPSAASDFLEKRFANNESIVFLAWVKSRAVGFTQLFTTFSSVSMQSVFILNDLYVVPEHRGEGIGRALLFRAQQYCISEGYKGLALETAMNNPAQKLYNRMGWEKDTEFLHYFWSAPV